MENLLANPVTQYVLLALALAVVVPLVALLEAKRRAAIIEGDETKSNLTRWVLESASTVAVVAVEQLTKIGEVEKSERRKVAVKYVTDILERRGFNIPVNEIVLYIENAVHELNQNKKPL